MTTKKPSLVSVDEDYFDMLLSPFSNFSHSIGSPPKQNRESEFQKEKKLSTFPADELFSKGKLLPPRLQMPQKLLHNNDATFGFVRSHSSLEDSRFPNYTTDLRLHSTNANVLSPSESCRFSSFHANPPGYLFEWFTGIDGLVSDHPKETWSKKLKQTKLLGLSQRLKASRAYIKSLFTKSGCSNESSAIAANKVEEVKKSCAQKNSVEIFCDRHRRSCAVTKTINSDMLEDGFVKQNRRSFSAVVQRHCASKASSLSNSSSGSSSSSSSFSLSSSGSYDLQLFKKRISENSELESSIEGAIAHCKHSQ